MMKKTTSWTAVALCATLMGSVAHAEGHYVAGVEGVQASSVPPPGNYYVGYLLNYDANSFRTPGSSTDLPGKNTATVTALANRFVKITETKVLGADYGFEAIVPVLHKSLSLGALPFDGSDSGIGDVYVGPLVLGWHGTDWDAVAGAGFWLSNGNTDDPSAPGNGYKSTMLTGGMTYYFDTAKSISGSALFRLENHGKNQSGVRPGNQVSLEWGLGKNFGAFQLGAVGYSQWQTGADGSGSTDKATKHALGAEVIYPVAAAGIILKGAVYKELTVEAGSGPTPKGNLYRLAVVKPF